MSKQTEEWKLRHRSAKQSKHLEEALCILGTVESQLSYRNLSEECIKDQYNCVQSAMDEIKAHMRMSEAAPEMYSLLQWVSRELAESKKGGRVTMGLIHNIVTDINRTIARIDGREEGDEDEA